MTALTLSRTQAAELCGISPTGFDGWVRRGIVPPPIPGTKRWSRVQLERALAGLPWVPPESGVASTEQGEDAYEAWRALEDVRDKHRPVHGLNERQERAFRTLVRLGTSNGKEISGAGEATFRYFVEKGLATRSPEGWSATAEGIAEVERINTWRNWHGRKG